LRLHVLYACHHAVFLGDDIPEYVIVLEQKKYAKVSPLEMAIYLAFSLYYCLNLEYRSGISRFYLGGT